MFMYSNMWEAILDLEVKMVSEHNENLSIRSGMRSNLVKILLHLLFGTFGSRDITFFWFNMALAAILDLKVKIVPKHIILFDM